MIECLDEDGYLRVCQDDIIKDLNIDKTILEESIDIIQELEPSGVCARSISECLLLQMKDLCIENKILEDIIMNDLELIALNKFKDISKKYNINMQKCINLISIIKTLNPKPGKICSEEKSIYIQPDVIVEKIDNEFVAYLNEKDSYKLKINNYYKEILKNLASDDDAKDFIKERLNSATG